MLAGSKSALKGRMGKPTLRAGLVVCHHFPAQAFPAELLLEPAPLAAQQEPDVEKPNMLDFVLSVSN